MKGAFQTKEGQRILDEGGEAAMSLYWMGGEKVQGGERGPSLTTLRKRGRPMGGGIPGDRAEE